MATRFIHIVTGTALLLTGLPFAPSTAVQAQSGRAVQDQGLCRNAPPLPQLGPERPYDQPQFAGTMEARGERLRADSPLSPAPPPPPPPPPAPPSIAPASPMVVTGSADARVASESSTPSPGRPIMPGPMPRPQPQPQSGLLTAGEHDDLLNPELYANYVRTSQLGQRIRDVPRVDTERVLTVEVRDNAGRAVPFASVELTCADGNRLTLDTMADGRAVFFPELDRLGSAVTMRVLNSRGVLGASRSIALSSAPGGQTVQVTARQSAPPVRQFDLVLVMDATGSMGDEMRYLQAELREVITDLSRLNRGMDIRLGFVFYRDEGDAYVTQTHGFDGNMQAQQRILAQQQAGGGGDYPEAMDQALIRAVGLEWRDDAVRSMLLVADAPPHNDRFDRTWAAAEVARANRIHIVPVAASGVGDEAEYVMRAMAAATQSRYLFLTDDSGIGNSHAPPAVDCYTVTRLDSLLRRVLAAQISGRRIEPERSEIIRTVGQYDAGRCILPNGYPNHPQPRIPGVKR